MSNKLFHTSNDETLLSGIHLDQEFKKARERKKPPIKPYPKHLKEALEKSIVTVVNRNDGSMECGVNAPMD